MKRSLLLASFLILFSAVPAAHGGDEIAVVAHSSAPDALALSELRPLFQTTRTTLAGERALPLNLSEGDSTRHGFDAAVLGLDPDRVARYWVDRKIRGGNPPPKSLPNSAMVLKVVATNPGAIGYVPSGEVSANVKVVARIRGGKVIAP